MALAMFWRLLALIALALTAGERAQAARLRGAWELDLKKLLRSRGGSHDPDLPVLALRFSPDGRQLAVLADPWWVDGRDGTAKGASRKQLWNRLFLIQAERPTEDIRWFDIPGILAAGEGIGRGSLDFGWSPSSTLIYAGGTVIRVANGAACHIPPDSQPQLLRNGGYLTENRAVFDTPGTSRPGSRGFRFFNDDCQPQEEWSGAEGWSISDISLDRGLVLMTRGNNALVEGMVIDPASDRVLQRWRARMESSGWTGDFMASGAVFANSGRAVCSGREDLPASKTAPVSCWDVDTGKKIAQAPTANGGNPLGGAARSTRIVASDYRRRLVPITFEYSQVFKRRVVWDFRSGRELLSWQPRSQSYYYRRPDPPSYTREPDPFAVSPDGESIAEGGNGIIRLYRLLP